jgi:hypothetical protein
VRDRSPRERHHAYWRALWEGLQICWPVFAGLLVLQALLGAAVGLVEGWGVGSGVYFAFITGLTVGYGDLVPTNALTRTISVLIGFCGIALTGLVAALAVRAFQVSGAGKKP